MLIPICCERLPVQLEIGIISAKGLPIMNKSINSTDAFVEVRFADKVEKTEVVTSLNPIWESELFQFDTDEKEISEEWMQFRVMDHDTYSANDAIGRINLDCNILVEKMRMLKIEKLDETYSLPIYDTLNGNRGELTFHVKLHLLMNPGYANYVQILSGHSLPSDYKLVEIVGLINDLKTGKDPDYEWLHKIRTPRATNEARQSAIRETLREAGVSLAHKADKHQCNLIIGYQEYLDVEGSSSDLFTVRVCGTALRVEKSKKDDTFVDKITYPILSINKIPCDRQSGIGAMVAARAVHILDDVEDAESCRKGWWNELRSELYQQAASVGCNLIIGYAEQFAVNDGIALLGCSGTAVVMGREEETYLFPTCVEQHNDILKSSSSVIKDLPEKERRMLLKDVREKRNDTSTRLPVQCSQFHTSFQIKHTPFNVKTSICSICRSGVVTDFLLATIPCPLSQYYIGPRNYLQVSITKKINSDPDESEAYALEVSKVLPFADHDVFNNLIGEARAVNSQGNAVFDIRCTYSISNDLLVSVVTGVLVRLICIPKDDIISPTLSNVLSFTNLQRYNDARRFSWGTVREAIRFKPSITPSISLKILNLKPPMMESMDDSVNSSKNRRRLNTFVGKIRRRQHEKEYMSHVVFERHVSASIGLLEGAGNSHAVAGIHMSPNMGSLILNKDPCDSMRASTRWSDVFIREDLTNTIKDSTSVDGFVTNSIEERISMARSISTLGGSPSVISHLKIAFPQFNVSKEHAHMIMLMSCDVNFGE